MVEKAEYEKAFKAYQKYCEEHGYIFEQPSKEESTIGRKYVHLRNNYREVAKYDIKLECIVE